LSGSSAENDPLLHAARQFARQLVGERRQADLLQHRHGAALALFLADPGHFQAEAGIRQHRPVRHQRKRLEHHAHVAPAQLDQLRIRHLRHVLAIHQDIAGAGIDQAVDQPDQGRLARTGQAHQHEYLALLHLERHVLHADHLPGLGKYLVFRLPSLQHVQG
jgi:hypothetical protein